MGRDINFYKEMPSCYEDKYSIRLAEYYFTYYLDSSDKSCILDIEMDYLDNEIAGFERFESQLYNIINGEKDNDLFDPDFILIKPEIEQLEPNDLEWILTKTEKKLNFLEGKSKDILNKIERVGESADNSDPEIEILKKDIRKHHENILERSIDIITDSDEFFQTECSFEEFIELTSEEMLKRVYLFEQRLSPESPKPNPEEEIHVKILEQIKKVFNDPNFIDKSAMDFVKRLKKEGVFSDRSDCVKDERNKPDDEKPSSDHCDSSSEDEIDALEKRISSILNKYKDKIVHRPNQDPIKILSKRLADCERNEDVTSLQRENAITHEMSLQEFRDFLKCLKNECRIRAKTIIKVICSTILGSYNGQFYKMGTVKSYLYRTDPENPL